MAVNVFLEDSTVPSTAFDACHIDIVLFQQSSYCWRCQVHVFSLGSRSQILVIMFLGPVVCPIFLRSGLLRLLGGARLSSLLWLWGKNSCILRQNVTLHIYIKQCLSPVSQGLPRYQLAGRHLSHLHNIILLVVKLFDHSIKPRRNLMVNMSRSVLL